MLVIDYFCVLFDFSIVICCILVVGCRLNIVFCLCLLGVCYLRLFFGVSFAAGDNLTNQKSITNMNTNTCGLVNYIVMLAIWVGEQLFLHGWLS